MSLFLIFIVVAVVYFFTFETMAPEVAVPFRGFHVDGSSWDCSGAVGYSSSFGKF